MTLDLEIDETYLMMLKRIEEQAPGNPRDDLARIVENQIHQSFQQFQNDNS